MRKIVLLLALSIIAFSTPFLSHVLLPLAGAQAPTAPGAGHGFALRGDPGFDEASAVQAERRVFAILDALG